MEDRLLNTFLAGTIDEPTFNAKRTQIRDEAAQVDETLNELGDVQPADVEAALAVFDFTQNAAEIWRGSKMHQKRSILETLSLNRTLSDVTLVTEKRKPFDILAERPSVQSSRGDTIRTCDLLLPKHYQDPKFHPFFSAFFALYHQFRVSQVVALWSNGLAVSYSPIEAQNGILNLRTRGIGEPNKDLPNGNHDPLPALPISSSVSSHPGRSLSELPSRHSRIFNAFGAEPT